MIHRRGFCQDYGLWASGACFDPATLTASAMAATAVGGAASAAGTLAGGNYAALSGQMQKAGSEFQAEQLEDNAAQSRASAQRTALDTAMKTRLAISTARARGAASGVDIGSGSPANVIGGLAKRGSYLSTMDMFNGESSATGLLNQAKGVRYSGDMALVGGEMQKDASRLTALGTLAGTAGSLAKTYGSTKYPEYRWGA